MPIRPPFRTASRALPFTLQQVAQACALTLLAGTALAQSTPPAVSLAPITVKAANGHAEVLPGVAPGGQVATGARLGMLGNVELIDTPFNVTAFTSEGIADLQAKTVASVLKTDPSVRMTTNEGHVVENFIIRGFAVGSSSLAINGVFGLAPEQNTPVEMFERIEVLKGPGAMMFGLPPSGDVGGAINLVPKRAGRDPLTRFTTTYSSKSNIGIHADVGRRLGDDQRLGVRFNGVLSGGETWLDHQTKKREVGHVAFDYQGAGWSVDADVYSVNNSVRKGSPMQPVLNGWTTVPAAPDGSTNFFYGEGVYSNTATRGVIVRGQAEVATDWSVFGSAGSAKHNYDGFIFGTRPVFPAANAATGNATGTAYNSWGSYETLTAEAGVRGRLVTGSVAHKVNVSANILKYQGGSRGNGTAPIASNLYNPTPIVMPAGASPATFSKFNNDTLTALSAVDTLSVLDERIQLTLGLRAQQVEQQLIDSKETAISPLVGIVVQPWGKTLALYGNYVEGLSPGDTVPAGYTNEGTAFKPYKSKQVEVGVKWVTGDITQTFALFQITRPALIDVTVDPNAAPPTLAQQLDGEQRNRGFEWNVFGKLGRDVSVLGGAAYTEAKQTRTQGGTNQGLRQVGVPKLTLNLGADWSLPFVPGLSLNARVNHTGAQALTGNNAVELPAWTTVDLGTRFSTRIAGKPVVLRAGVNNVTDKAYFESIWGAGRVNVGAPRAFNVSATADF